jgi:hypothetical protein
MPHLHRKIVTKTYRPRAVAYFLNSTFDADKAALELQRLVLEAHSRKIIPRDGALAEAVNRHARDVEWRVDRDGQAFDMLTDISSPASRFTVALIGSCRDGSFWKLRRCEYQPCSKFFFPEPKRRYCSRACLRSSNIAGAQERVEKSRRLKRFEEIKKKLERIKQLSKSGTSDFDLMERLPGFNPSLLKEIVHGKRAPEELSEKIKYKNRRILMKAKLPVATQQRKRKEQS